MIRALRRDEVTFTVTPMSEITPVRGNAMASDDPAYDKEVEDRIIADLDNGNEWAWCSVRVTASWESYTGHAFLGCCSYADEAEFRRGGYLEQMEEEALDDLNETIQHHAERLEKLRVND